MKSNPVGWFEIYVQDMKRARKFYEAVFQGELQKIPNTQFEMYGFPMQDNTCGAPGALIKIEGCPSGHNSVLIYFSCVDCAVEEKRALANGGTLHRSKMSIGEYGFISLIVDTEGNMIGLHSRQ